MTVVFALLWLGCEKQADETADPGDPPVELEIPELSDVDLPALYEEALERAIAVDLRTAWAAHVATVEAGTPGCPDFYAGTYDLESEEIDEDATGLAWYDQCTAGSLTYGGYAYWETAIAAAGDATADTGLAVDATRTLTADGTVSSDDEVWFEFDGTATDAVSVTTAPGYQHWTYSSSVVGTLTGTLPFDPATSDTVGGYRTDMVLDYAAGAGESLEARGNVYYFETRLAGRFDSIAMDLYFVGPDNAPPDTCTLEPQGWLSVRDGDAFWYDLVFEPRYDEDQTDENYSNDPYTSCDGCGTLYVRGVEQAGMTVCPDFSFLWSGVLAPPDPAEFSLSLRDLEEP